MPKKKTKNQKQTSAAFAWLENNLKFRKHVSGRPYPKQYIFGNTPHEKKHKFNVFYVKNIIIPQSSLPCEKGSF